MEICGCGHTSEEHSAPGEFPCTGDDGDCWCFGFHVQEDQ